MIGGGVSGLTAARLLAQRYEVHLFEAAERLGGHTHTHDVSLFGQTWRVDSGFIVFNEPNYPLFSRLLRWHGVPSQPTTMSFAVKNERSGLEYNATSLGKLFSQRRNLVRPRFFGMISDLLRFYREAPALLSSPGVGPSIGGYLEDHNYGRPFAEDHLLPMASALWSTPLDDVRDYPAKYMLEFMSNHRMLSVSGRPQWRVVRGGSDRYIEPLLAASDIRVSLGCPVQAVSRRDDGVELTVGDAGDRYSADAAVFACHSDQALGILADPTPAEHAVLTALRYQANEAVLHWDRNLLPRRRRAWAAWNALVGETADSRCTVTYNMSMLQGLPTPEPICVTLNRDDIAPDKIVARMRYHHPRYDSASVRAQGERMQISGHGRTWYCGAYWGHGFHEDGVRSAVDVARCFDVGFPDA